jgi:alanyl-tRNA synthetase
MTAQELREKWLEFYKDKGHTIVPSASLVPENDPSVLFTMAGMFPLVPYLMGQDHPGGRRIANVQKCIRTIDIDEVGDDTHLTFFEMLGNWSFGDYFKKEAIEWSFEFLTDKKWLGLPVERLAFSVFAGSDTVPRDEESASHWLRLGVAQERIAYLGAANFWIAGSTGPCGGTTEMFYWKDDGTPAPANFQDTSEDPRWVEIWNDVFMEFNKQPDGTLVPLQQKNVDTGMGLDRTIAMLNGQSSVYDTELFTGMFEVLALDQEVMSNDEVRRARIIVDHVRAAVMIASDGVEPTNKDRGYILRRLLRRSMVYGKLLNLQHHWLKALIGKVVSGYAQAYPELVDRSEHVYKTLEGEQEKFGKTLEKGLKEFEKVVEKKNGISGEDAFNLYQTYGFPWELTKDLAETAGYLLIGAGAGFETEFKKHQDLSRTSSAGTFKGGLASHSEKATRYHTATHLLHKALRVVLGPEVWQKGSHINDERTRFDFTYPQKLTEEQKLKIEELVNEWIGRDAQVEQEMMPLEKARELGAIGLFGEKYADTVSIYTITDKEGNVISREFCGGPHVEHTAMVGKFKIAKEEAISAGVRRIKGVIEP